MSRALFFLFKSRIVGEFGVEGASETAYIRQVCRAASETPSPKIPSTLRLLNFSVIKIASPNPQKNELGRLMFKRNASATPSRLPKHSRVAILLPLSVFDGSYGNNENYGSNGEIWLKLIGPIGPIGLIIIGPISLISPIGNLGSLVSLGNLRSLVSLGNSGQTVISLTLPNTP